MGNAMAAVVLDAKQSLMSTEDAILHDPPGLSDTTFIPVNLSPAAKDIILAFCTPPGTILGSVYTVPEKGGIAMKLL